MTFAPPQKTSKSKSRVRTSAWLKRTALKLKNKVALNNEGNWLAHFIAIDWTYNGRQVLKIKSKAKNITRI